MHILLFHFYSSSPNPAYQNLAGALRKRGHVVWIGEPDGDGNLRWRDQSRAIETIPGPGEDSTKSLPIFARWTRSLTRFVRVFRFVRRIRKFIHTHRPDIVHVNPSYLPGLLPIFMPRDVYFLLDIKQINLDIDEGWLTKLKEWLMLVNYRLCATLLYNHTSFHHEAAARRVLGPGWPVHATVVPVGIDPAFLEIEPSLHKVDDKVRFLYVGGITRFRKLDILLNAAKQLHELNRAFVIDFYGPDRAGGYYHDLIDELELNENVRINPPVEYSKIPSLMTQYDVGLAYVPHRPTWHLQPTLKILELRAAGLPILSTDVQAHREVLEQGVNGLLVGDSAQEIANGLQRFLEDPAFLARCKENAREMRTGLTWEEVAGMYETKIYRGRITDEPLVLDRAQ